jgi:NADH:ubiquinone oxidoreductase subunit H
LGARFPWHRSLDRRDRLSRGAGLRNAGDLHGGLGRGAAAGGRRRLSLAGADARLRDADRDGHHRSLRPADIVDVQHAVPMALVQPLALALWLPSVLAVCFLPPFDLPQADAELGGGAFAEYRGLDAALVALAQRVLLLAVSGMTAALFLSGWHGPLLPPVVWMAVKTAGVAALLLWIGRQVPRVEIDRVLSLAWKIANPLAIAAIVYAGLITLLFYR